MKEIHNDNVVEISQSKRQESGFDPDKRVEVFFEKNNVRLKGSQIEEATEKGKKELIHSINEKVKEFSAFCQSNKQNIPTEIKLMYEIDTKRLSSDFNYDLQYINTETSVVQDVFDEWFNLCN